MFKICYADMAKATHVKEMKKRPVVVINDLGKSVVVLKITSRMRDDKHHVRMNPFLVHGFCDISKYYVIEKKYILNYIRNCTVSENEQISENFSWKRNK